MRVVVLGGGVVGVTSAYYLAKDGHEVHLVEERSDVGQKATAGNAGVIAPNHSYAWASPKAPKMLFSSLFGKQTAIQVRLRLDPELLAWGMRFLAQCTDSRARRNTLNKLRLCVYSRQCLNDLVAEESIEYSELRKGMLYLCRTQAELDAEVAALRFLAEHGNLRQETLDADGVARVEPALAPVKHKFAGAVHGVDDQTGDATAFTQALLKRCVELGVEVSLNTAVTAFSSDGSRVTGVRTSGGNVTGDAYVLSLGIYSGRLAKTAGVRLPIYPAKGYSVNFPVRSGSVAPFAAAVDEATLVAWSRRGDVLRMTSTAEFSGFGEGWEDKDFGNILKTARELLPDAAEYDQGVYRSCMRPMTPDGPPIIGRVPRLPNLYVNSGHGHMGWTMACGSSRILADLVASRRPEIDTSGFQVRS